MQLSAPIMVYVDGTRRGAPGVLRDININVIQRMERLSASEATGRLGTDHPNGAILVIRK